MIIKIIKQSKISHCQYEDNIATNGLSNVSFHVVEKESGTPVHEILANYANNEKPSFVVCAPDPQLERIDALSVSERIVKNVKSNCILYKVPQKTN